MNIKDRWREINRKLDQDTEQGYSWKQRIIGGTAVFAAVIGGLELSLHYEIPQNITQEVGEIFGKDVKMYNENE